MCVCVIPISQYITRLDDTKFADISTVQYVYECILYCTYVNRAKLSIAVGGTGVGGGGVERRISTEDFIFFRSFITFYLFLYFFYSFVYTRISLVRPLHCVCTPVRASYMFTFVMRSKEYARRVRIHGRQTLINGNARMEYHYRVTTPACTPQKCAIRSYFVSRECFETGPHTDRVPKKTLKNEPSRVGYVLICIP